MVNSLAVRLSVGDRGVSVWSPEIFQRTDTGRVRDFLSRTFAVPEVEAVELQPAKSLGRVCYAAMKDPAVMWRKLSQALRSSALEVGAKSDATSVQQVDATQLYLGITGTSQIRVSRIGSELSTWRVHNRSAGQLRLRHPMLRSRREVAFRLEEELSSLFGIKDFRVSALTGTASIRFDTNATTEGRLARALEKAWPRILSGADKVPSRRRLIASSGILGLAYAGQYLVPPLRPVAVAGVAIYSFPNVVNAAKQLRHGRIGLPALYSTGLAFTLITGLPFTASVMAAFMQLWPALAHRSFVSSQRRAFSAHRRRPVWARLVRAEGVDVEVDVDELLPGDRILVRKGETVPADGVVLDGIAAVVNVAAFVGSELEDRSRGDTIAAGAIVRHGSVVLKVDRSGTQTAASHFDSLLPRATSSFSGLPSLLDAERIANRNVKPILAIAALNLILARVLQPSQAVIRPDCATAPRLSAQLSALQGIAQGWQRGVLFRTPTALERLSDTDVYVIDETARLEVPSVEVAEVHTVDAVPADLVVHYARAARPALYGNEARALAGFVRGDAMRIRAGSLQRFAGVTRYRDALGKVIEIASLDYVTSTGLAISDELRTKGAHVIDQPTPGVEEGARDAVAKPLCVLRDGTVIGLISFARVGELVGKQFVAKLKAQNKRARIIYLSHHEQHETQALARTIGIESSFGGLSTGEKVALIRSLGRDSLWIGDGADPNSLAAMEASAVSVSVASLLCSRDDAADILMLHRGLAGLTEVIDIAHRHAKRLRQDYGAVYTVNLLGAAGAFLANFTSLQTGLLSNFGSAWVFARHAWALRKLVSVTEERFAY